MTNRRVLRSLWLISVAVLAVGCGAEEGATPRETQRGSTAVTSPPATAATTSTTEAPRQIEIVNKGFTQLKPDIIGNSYLSYAAIVRNPNAAQIASRIQVNSSFYDAAGTVVKAKSDNITALGPGESAAVGPIGGGEQAAGAVRMEVTARVSEWIPLTTVSPGRFAFEGVATRARPGGYGQTTTGTIVSSFASDLKSVQLVAVYYDRNGGVIGGAFTFVDFVPAGGKLGAEVVSTQAVPGIARSELYAAVTNLSLS